MGFALNAFKKYQDTLINNDSVYNGQQINQSRLNLGKSGETQSAGLARQDNRLSLALAGDSLNYRATSTELDSLENKKRNPENDHDLDGFRSFGQNMDQIG